MPSLTMRSAIASSVIASITITVAGFVGLMPHLSYLLYLLYPGMYLFRDAGEGLGIFAFILAVPINIAFFAAVSFGLLALTVKFRPKEDQ